MTGPNCAGKLGCTKRICIRARGCTENKRAAQEFRPARSDELLRYGRRFRISVEGTKSLLVLFDEIPKQYRETFRGMRTQDDAIGQLDRHFFHSLMPGLIDTEHENNFLTRAHGVAHVRVRALHT